MRARAVLTYSIEGDRVRLEEVRLESEGHNETIPVVQWQEDHVPFILWRLRGTRGVCLIVDEQGRRRYLPAIIARAMELAGRKIRILACAPSMEELMRAGY